MPSYVVTYSSYEVLKMVRFLAQPVYTSGQKNWEYSCTASMSFTFTLQSLST